MNRSTQNFERYNIEIVNTVSKPKKYHSTKMETSAKGRTEYIKLPLVFQNYNLEKRFNVEKGRPKRQLNK